MTNQYTVTLTDAEKKALEYVAISCDDWIQNAVHERCRAALEELVADTIKTSLESGKPIVGTTKEDIALNSTLPSAQVRHEEFPAKQLAE